MAKSIQRLLLLPLAALLLAAAALGGEMPRHPRLAAGPAGEILGGYQAEPGSGGSFELFTWEAENSAFAGLGRFNGQLAGVAWDSAGRPLALTRDGSLAHYGDESGVLAIPDDRWNMQDLAWFADSPVALHAENGRLYLARPLAPETWRLDDEPIAREDRLFKAALVPAGNELHLIWGARARDLSRGALRHMVMREGRWEELPSLPIGDVRFFAAFARGNGLEVLAVVPDLLDSGQARVARKIWRDGSWSDGPAPEGDLTERLLASVDASGIAVPGGRAAWLATGPDGAFLDRIRVAPGGRSGAEWSEWGAVGLLAAFALLLFLYCRRSRQLSRMFPGRPADLTSRAAALALDWLFLSVGLSAYHFAAGDMRIYHELLNFGDVNAMFWLTLGGLAFYASVFEGIFGATPGKYLAGLRVRSALGGPPTFLQAMFRNLMRAVDMFPVLFPGVIGMAAAMLNPRRQRVGDMLAATLVRRHAPALDRRFVLASASPRRRELLEALGLTLRVDPADIDEDSVRGGDPEETARLLAEAKARAAAERLTVPGEVVVAADTMVVLDGEVLGKPRDAAEASGMLSRLSGRSHQVLTGVMVWDSATGQGMSDVERTEVEFRELSPREIAEYVATGDPMDKAGAYGIQTGYLVKQVRGSLSNVAGLPMEMVRGMLEALDS